MPDTLKPTERTTPAMVYAAARLIWGQLVHPETVRPQVWLKHTIAPEFLHFHDAQVIVFGGREPVRSAHISAHVPVSRVLAFHLLPPAEYEPDYDEFEPNRAMADVVVSCDIFRFEGLCRIATIAEFSSSIQGFRETFRPFYAVSVSHPTAPMMQPLLVPYVLIRAEEVVYLTNRKAENLSKN
jgi:hypothetical protein